VGKKTWIFSTYKWHGNPKALYLYMEKNKPEYEIWWMADSAKDAKKLKKKGIRAFSKEGPNATKILSECHVYVTENVRINYPISLNDNVRILNLWHGVGIKYIENNIREESTLYTEIAKKNIKNAKLLKRNQMVLVTSEKMEEHFKDSLRINDNQLLRGVYPRNIVYKDKDIRKEDISKIIGRNPANIDEVILYAPTWRHGSQEGVIKKLIPDIIKMNDVLNSKNKILIFKAHPFIERTNEYRIFRNIKGISNIIFWPEDHDIYEVFENIDMAIIDYSSIFYDLLNAGVKKFIRYIPDYKEHIRKEGLFGNYFEETTGEVAHNFIELLNLLECKLSPSEDIDKLTDRFFGYQSINKNEINSDTSINMDIENIISEICNFKPISEPLPTLYSFDLFDTLIRRKTLSPISVFQRTKELLRNSNLKFSEIFIQNYVQIRRDTERECRNYMNDTTNERGTSKIEISFDKIFDKIQEVFDLNDEQISFIKKTEVSIEFEILDIHPKINQLKKLIKSGESVVIISDMYLPKKIIKNILVAADPILENIPLYLSSEIGHKKDTGDLYLRVYYDIFFQFERWVHFGDNYLSDGKEAKKLGIESQVHDIDCFTSFEKFISESEPNFDAHKVATLIQRYRWKMLDKENYKFNEEQYFAYAYGGSILVPYVLWVLDDAIKRGYKILYFVSRDGYFLKKIADVIISENDMVIKTKYIYGSRKVWRSHTDILDAKTALSSIYGPITGLKTLEEISCAVGLSNKQLLEIIPELESFKNFEPLKKSKLELIKEKLINNKEFLDLFVLKQQKKEELTIMYIAENINLNEKFGIVDFWGRGATQSYLAKTIAKISGKKVETPFYYANSIWDSEWPCIRHKFMRKPFKLNFIEPIFSTTPHNSISQYKKKQGGAEPVINTCDNKYHEKFTKGMSDFARDFCRSKFDTQSCIAKLIFSRSIDYFYNTKNDQYICNVYGNLFYSEGSYSGNVKQATVLYPQDIKTNNIKTNNISLSLAKSCDKTRYLYSLKMIRKGKIVKLPKKLKLEFPNIKLTNHLKVKKGNLLHMIDVFNYSMGPTESKVSIIEKGEIGSLVPVHQIKWNRYGLPKAWSGEGFVSLNKNSAEILNELVSVSEILVYESIEAIKNNEVNFKLPKNSLIKNIYVHFDPEIGSIIQSDQGYLRLDQDKLRAKTPPKKKYITKTVYFGIVKKSFYLYRSPELKRNERIDRKKFRAGMILFRMKPVTSEKGLPRLKLRRGFTTANTDYVIRII
jgi:predicted HAD superfamily hydrolase/CDP-glycerol glycerophosphotransferase (TagB/SpsB family)